MLPGFSMCRRARASFLFKAKSHSTVWRGQIASIRLLGCFHLLTTVSNAAVNVGREPAAREPAFSARIDPEGGLPSEMLPLVGCAVYNVLSCAW